MKDIPVKVRWGKKNFTETIRPGSSTDAFKERIRILTGVPKERQKILCKGAWEGILRDGTKFDEQLSLSRGQASLVVTLIGSADELPDPPKIQAKFIEDLTPEELAATKAQEDEAAMKSSEGMIVALQKPPSMRDDNKMEMYQYNRVVTGLPQRQIENLLRRRSESQRSSVFLGEVVMTLGLELRRAYINALAVLPCNGTLVSASDDGHIMAWRHGEREFDVIHDGIGEEGVDCLVSLNHREVAFATGGRGCIRLWTADGDCVQALNCPPGVSPNCLVAMHLGGGGCSSSSSSSSSSSGASGTGVCLVSSFQITRHTNPNQFWLVPQDEAGRQRRAEAEAREAVIQEQLAHYSRSVCVWFSSNGSTQLQSFLLKLDHLEVTAPVTTMAVLHNEEVVVSNNQNDVVPNNQHDMDLVCGDSVGGLRVWSVQTPTVGEENHSPGDMWEHKKILQLCPPNVTETAKVVCMEPLTNRRWLAVSTDVHAGEAGTTRSHLSGAIPINISTTRAVFLVDLDSDTIKIVLDAHKDSVQCMRSLPSGGLFTGGGKLDAKLRVWDQSQLRRSGSEDGESKNLDPPVLSETTDMKEIGYVFALAVLPDSRLGSQHYALAAARYNVVKICL